MYQLYLGNKNYSSWSLRAWLLMRQLGIEFTEHLLPFGQISAWQAFRLVSPAGKVPTLVDEGRVVWDSLAIAEYLAESHPVWPAARHERAWARSAAAEMHSSFADLRHYCSMSCGIRVSLHERPVGLERDIARLASLWSEGLRRFGGPFLVGNRFTAADAFFAPVAFRVQTYDLQLPREAAGYVQLLLELPAMRAWYAAALEETLRDEPHELEITSVGSVVRDLRRGAPACGQGASPR